MHSLLSTLALALYAAAATANAAALEPRQGTAGLSNVTCGRASYTKQQVDAAVAEGCRLHAAGDQLGSSKYPHRFNNREGLVFAVAGPYQEFPILASGAVYSGSACLNSPKKPNRANTPRRSPRGRPHRLQRRLPGQLRLRRRHDPHRRAHPQRLRRVCRELVWRGWVD